MKDPEAMTEFEIDALWTWGATKAEIRAAQAKAAQREQQARDAAQIAAWRAKHPEATELSDRIALVLARMERDLTRA